MIKTPLTWIANAIRFILAPISRDRSADPRDHTRPVRNDNLNDGDPLGGDPAYGGDDGWGGEDGDGDGDGGNGGP